MNPFSEHSRGHGILERIRAETPTLGLGQGDRCRTNWLQELAGIGDEELLGETVADGSMAAAVRSGLLLRADLLDASHTISQGIETPTGSYWHGIMHRREGDFGNSKYWFRRVGDHPVFPDLAGKAAALGQERTLEIYDGGRWDPFLFIDACESRFRGARDRLAEELEALQELEIDLLLGFSLKSATGR